MTEIPYFQPAPEPSGFTVNEWHRYLLRHALSAIEAGASAPLVMNLEGLKDNIRKVLAVPAPEGGERAAFEVWMKGLEGYPYAGKLADRMWQGWQARAALAAPRLEDIEQYRLQMAGISTAALGYWKESDGILPDYDTLALRDVAKLYAKYDVLFKMRVEAQANPPQPAEPSPAEGDTAQYLIDAAQFTVAPWEPTPWMIAAGESVMMSGLNLAHAYRTMLGSGPQHPAVMADSPFIVGGPQLDVQPKGTDKPFGWLDVHPDGRERIARPGRLHDSDARWVRKATLYEHPPETPDDAWAAAHQLSNQSHQDFIRGVQWATQRGKK